MAPPLRPWYSAGIIATLKRTWHTHHLMDGVSSILRKPGNCHLQKCLYNALMHTTGITKAKIVLRRRICYWKPSEPEANLIFDTLYSPRLAPTLVAQNIDSSHHLQCVEYDF